MGPLLDWGAKVILGGDFHFGRGLFKLKQHSLLLPLWCGVHLLHLLVPNCLHLCMSSFRRVLVLLACVAQIGEAV